MDNQKNRQIVSSNQSEQSRDRTHPSMLNEAIIYLVHQNLFDGVISIGVIAGIIHYLHTRDSWLLTLFISLKGGGAIEKYHQTYQTRRTGKL